MPTKTMKRPANPEPDGVWMVTKKPCKMADGEILRDGKYHCYITSDIVAVPFDETWDTGTETFRLEHICPEQNHQMLHVKDGWGFVEIYP